MRTKTAVKPKMNIVALSSITFLSCLEFSLVRSSKEIPVIKDTYDGTKGSTHGEINESMPPKNARAMETSVFITVSLSF